MDVRQMELKDMISCLRIEGKGMRQICRVAAYLNQWVNVTRISSVQFAARSSAGTLPWCYAQKGRTQ